VYSVQLPEPVWLEVEQVSMALCRVGSTVYCRNAAAGMLRNARVAQRLREMVHNAARKSYVLLIVRTTGMEESIVAAD
jgi:hypothetical protein